jgi:hypothetical protein
MSEYAERILCVKLEQNNQLVLLGLVSNCTQTYVLFFEVVPPVKAVENFILSQILEIKAFAEYAE